jgi:hypothetical protein
MAAPSSVKVGLPPAAISFRRLIAHASGEQFEALDRAGKSQSVVDVALGKMKAKSAGDQRRANQKQNAGREHHDGWIDDLAHRGGNASNCPVPARSAINRYPCIANDGVAERRQIAVLRGATRECGHFLVQTKLNFLVADRYLETDEFFAQASMIVRCFLRARESIVC